MSIHDLASPETAAYEDEHMRRFLEDLRNQRESIEVNGRPLFDPSASIVVARAPGRLDVMGGIADYSGSLVLQWPIREATLAAAQVVAEPGLRIVSRATEGGHAARSLEIDGQTASRLLAADYAEVRRWFAQDPSRQWAAYVVGVLVVLAQQRQLELDCGLRILVDSQVPEGKGVSSSAALEVATMQAVSRLLGLELDGVALATLCQMAENYVVVTCGIMDQMTSALGRAHSLLALLCQPAEVLGFVTLPASVGFWGIDSGIRHAVSGSDYTSVRVGAFMGYRIIAERAGLRAVAPSVSEPIQVVDSRWSGYLANVSTEEFDRDFAADLPDSIAGDEFLRRYGGTTDQVTNVDPRRVYAVRQPTAHPVREHARVRRFAELLAGTLDDSALREMGELMYGSHASYSACGLGSDGTDLLVDLVRQAGPESGLFGAKITGGGSGGTVAILGLESAGPAVEEIARRYQDQTGRQSYLFSGSSPGACAFGLRRV